MIKKTLTRGLLVLACGTTAFTVGTMTTQPVSAAAVTTYTAVHLERVPAPVDWTDQTCHALEAWQRDQTPGRLDRLVVNAGQLPTSYLKADVFELAADAASPSTNAAKYLSVAIQYADEDCSGGA